MVQLRKFTWQWETRNCPPDWLWRKKYLRGRREKLKSEEKIRKKEDQNPEGKERIGAAKSEKLIGMAELHTIRYCLSKGNWVR